MCIKKNAKRYLFLLICLYITSQQLIAQVSSVLLHPEHDSFVVNTSDTTNYGSSTSLSSGVFIFFGTAIVARTFLTFDLTNDVPPNAIVTSTSLHLEVNSGSTRSMALERLDASWDESTVRWNNKPGVTGSSVITTPGTSSQYGYDYHDYTASELKNIVQHWVNYPNLNNGVSIRAEIETTHGMINYTSKEAGVSYILLYPGGPIVMVNHMPRLHIEYVLPIEIELVSTTHCTTTSSTDGSITISASEGDGTYTYQWYNSSGSTIGTNSPTISGLGYGWYGVKVTDGLGVISYMSFLVGVECETVSIAYNPGPNYVDDALVSSYYAPGSDSRDNNYVNHQYWGVRRYYTALSGYYNWHSFLRFRLLVDNTLKFNTANLLVNAYISVYNSSNQIYLYRTVSDWQENVVTYNTSPTRSSSITASWGSSATGVKTIDVKEFFDYWKNNPNYGFYVDVENPTETVTNRQMEVRSSDYTTTSQRPRMEFEVSLKCTEPATLRERNDGAVYFMQRPILKFHFDELRDAETSEKLKFDIRNSSNTVIASSDHAGNVTGISGAVTHQNNGNYHTLYLSALNLVPSEYYTLTVYTISGKKLYLNFIKTN